MHRGATVVVLYSQMMVSSAIHWTLINDVMISIDRPGRSGTHWLWVDWELTTTLYNRMFFMPNDTSVWLMSVFVCVWHPGASGTI